MQQNAIKNIIAAQDSAIEEIEEATAQANGTSISETPEKLLPSPVREFEQELQGLFANIQDTQESKLVIGPNRTYSLERSDMTFLSVVIEENGALIVPSKFSQVTVRIMKFVAKKGARIVARGAVGTDGGAGDNGKNGSTCEDGDNGQNGEPGQRGKNGTTVEILAIDFVLASTMTVDTSGGNGGNGGRGGNGGSGGQASRGEGCGGGAGGAGGVGGSAGVGGNSGTLSIHYVRAYSPGDGGKLVSLPIVKTLVKHMATPGTAGLPGAGGNGGFGGSGMARQSLPRGANGTDGILGQSGSPGTRGSTTIVQGPRR